MDTSLSRRLEDLDVEGKVVLVRADLNVPMKDGVVGDKTRITVVAPTIDYLSKHGAKVVVMSHFGRPGGKADPALSLAPIAEPLGAVLSRPVTFVADCVGDAAQSIIAQMKDGDVALLENLRFHAGEEANDQEFAGELAALGDLYVMDAFSCAHRAHASVEAIAHLLPGAPGNLMDQELIALESVIENPKSPAAGIIGGAKVSTKLEVLGNLTARLDKILIGGAMANTFLAATGVNVGASLCEHDMAETAQAVLDKAQKAGCDIVLPVDAVVAKELAADVATRTVAIGEVPEDSMILDIGPESAGLFTERLGKCESLVWNGPLGAFETKPFDTGTNGVARAVAEMTKNGKLISVAGGGDTVAALAHAGVINDLIYVSTAGGAFLEFIEGKDLPGIIALKTATKIPLPQGE